MNSVLKAFKKKSEGNYTHRKNQQTYFFNSYQKHSKVFKPIAF